LADIDDPAGRELLHTREITCRGYARHDGLYDIEGTLRDLTNAPTELPFHRVEEGGAIHEMRLRMTIDADLQILQVSARTVQGASPFCGEIAPAYARLQGLTIGPGFKKSVKTIVGGAGGCTHMTELLERMASTAMQTLFSVYRSNSARQARQGARKPVAVRPWVIGTCHAYREDGDAVRLLWPQGLPPANPS